MALTGLTGYSTVNGARFNAYAWDNDFKCQDVDRTSQDTNGDPLPAAGQRSGDFTIEVKIEGPLPVAEGGTYTFELGVTATLNINFSGLVTSVRVKTAHDANVGPTATVTGKRIGAANTRSVIAANA